MTALGVFRDDYYNAASVLTLAQYNTNAAGNGTVIAASTMSGAEICNILSSVATALTTDTAVNIIANLQSAIAAAIKAGNAGFGAGVNPPVGVPNLFNFTWILEIQDTAAALTITGGTGVTLVGSAAITTLFTRRWLCTVTSPTTITMQTLGEYPTTA
jgi:hypothetical protein